MDKWIVYVNQGQGEVVGPEFPTLEGALEYIGEHRDEGSFALKGPEGFILNLYEMISTDKILGGVREYAEGYAVRVKTLNEYFPGGLQKLFNTGEYDRNRLVVVAINEGGYNTTAIDLVDLLKWVKENKPELLK